MRPGGTEVIVNASSGAGVRAEVRQRLVEAFEAAGAHARISLAADGADLVRLAHRAARGDAEIVVAGGGDGTMSSVAAALIGSDKTLGVLPLGTMNHFAKDLGIPLDVEGAVRTIVAGHAVRVDVGDVNGRIFLNNSSLGLYPRIIRERERQQRLGWGKWPAYVWAALAVLRRYPFLEIRLSVDGRERRAGRLSCSSATTNTRRTGSRSAAAHPSTGVNSVSTQRATRDGWDWSDSPCGRCWAACVRTAISWPSPPRISGSTRGASACGSPSMAKSSSWSRRFIIACDQGRCAFWPRSAGGPDDERP